MYRFKRELPAMNISGVRFGGQPGEFPTVLCGTIFYQGHKIIQNEERGIFDRASAERLIARQTELSNETGNPSIIHIYARTVNAFQRYLDFVDGVWDGPFIMDSADSSTRSKMAEIVSEFGYGDKAIYNSISPGTDVSEERAIRNSEVDSSILLAYNPTDPSVDGSINVLETGGSVRARGLIDLARELGIVNLLLDPGAMPLGNGGGLSLRFSVVAKARFGLPVGSGIHNAVSSWPWLNERGLQERRCCDAAAAAMQLLSAADFLLYGPIENADFIFPVAAMADIMVAEAVKDLDIWPVPGHPINRLL